MPFAFCTREKSPWCEYAEEAENGASTQFLKQVSDQEVTQIVSNIK